jgi:hypothetical protein
VGVRQYIQVEMFPVDCPRCGQRSWVPPPQSEAEFLDIKCLCCPWYPFYFHGGNPDWEEKNIEDFQAEHY